MAAAQIAGTLHVQRLNLYLRSIGFLAVTNRAARSIPQNVAEGCGRTTCADKAKHYTIASWAMECAAHLDIMELRS